MAQINLHLNKSLFVPKFYPLLFDYSHRWEVYKGSAGSSKSYFITQKIICRCCKEKIKVLVCRRTKATIRNSCFDLFKEILTNWKIIQYVKIRENDFYIRFPNGSEVIFIGLDEETKLLSLNGVGTIFIEEAYEVPKNIVEQLNLRMRGKIENQQILMAFNPISKSHWLYDFCEENPPSSFLYTQSTYKDNPFLSSEYVEALDEMAERNPSRYRVYGLGEWGVDSEGLVITNWQAEKLNPIELAREGFEHRSGMDLGFNDPSAITDTFYDRENKTIYVFNEFYKRGCQLSELVDAIKDMKLTKSKLYVDSAEPRSIEYFNSEGLNTVGARKGKDSVKLGLMFLQNQKIIVDTSCTNLIMELENFSYKKNRLGEYTDTFTHEYSHAIDSLRYAYSDIYTNRKLKSLDKNLL